MSIFCSGCGSARTAAEEFCGNCWQRPDAAAKPTAIVNPPAKRSSPITKILLILVGCFLLCGILGAAALYYAGRRVEKKASDMGLDLGSVIQKAAESAGRSQDKETASESSPVEVKDACTLLTNEEVGEIIGVPV